MDFSLAFTRNQRLLVDTSVEMPSANKQEKISFIKSLACRALMICSRTNLGSGLDRIKQLLIDSRYPKDVLLSYIKAKLANVSSENLFGCKNCPICQKLPLTFNFHQNLNLNFHQINRAITSRFHAVKPLVICNTRVMLSSAKTDPTWQKSCLQ